VNMSITDSIQWMAILCLSIGNILRENAIRRLQRELNK